MRLARRGDGVVGRRRRGSRNRRGSAARRAGRRDGARPVRGGGPDWRRCRDGRGRAWWRPWCPDGRRGRAAALSFYLCPPPASPAARTPAGSRRPASRSRCPMSFIQNNWMLILVAFLSGAMLVWPLVQRRFSPMKDVGNLNATHLINHSDAVLLDVRETKEYEGGRLPNAVHIPLSQLDGRAAELASSRAGRSIAYCASGARRRMAGDALAKQGFTDTLQSRRRRPGVEGRRPAAGEVAMAAPKVTMYATAVCPYCVQAERLLQVQGRHRHRQAARRHRPGAARRDDREDRPAHGAADLHRRLPRRRLRRPGRARPRRTAGPAAGAGGTPPPAWRRTAHPGAAGRPSRGPAVDPMR